MIQYQLAKETSEMRNISSRRVQILCEQGRIDVAFKLKDVWVVPKDAVMPEDRIKIKLT